MTRQRTCAANERGSIMILSVVGIVVAVIAAALAVDLGRLASDKRDDQKIADLAAMDAVRVLPADPTAAAVASAKRNNKGIAWPGTITTQWSASTSGPWSTDTTPAVLVAAAAVKVTVGSTFKNAFPLVGNPNGPQVSAVSTKGNGTGCSLPSICVQNDNSDLGTVRVGSSLASADSTDALLLNNLLANTVGGTYSTDVVGWQGIAAGNVKFDLLRQQLGGTFATGTAATALDTDVYMRNVLDATVNALNADGSASSATAATKLATIASSVGATAGAQFKLRKLFDVVGNVGSGNDVADARINALDIVRGAAILADTDHFATFNLTSTDIPGLPGTGVTVDLGLIEAPQMKSGKPGTDGLGNYYTSATTSQIRVRVTVNLASISLGILGNVAASVPYYFGGGNAKASLDTMTCAANAATPSNVAIYGQSTAAASGINSVSDADLKDTTAGFAPTLAPATLASVSVLTLGLVNIQANIATSIPANSGTTLNFVPDYTSDSASKALTGTSFVSLPTATSSNVVAKVGALTLGLDLSSLVSAINAVASPLTTKLLTPLFRSLGLSIGGADIWAPPPQECNPTSYNVGGGSGPYNPLPVLAK